MLHELVVRVKNATRWFAVSAAKPPKPRTAPLEFPPGKKVYFAPRITKLDSEQAILRLVARAYEGDASAHALLEVLIPRRGENATRL